MKRAQAAMEFLMTYGWAILVVLIAIGALAYFGVLNPSRFLPNSCTLIPGLSCDEFLVDSTGVTIIARNGMGEDLTGVTLSLVGDGTACAGDSDTADEGTAAGDWADGATETFIITCTVPPSGSRFKSDVTIAYTKGTLPHSATGTITTQIE